MSDFIKVPYPIPGDEEGGELHIHGDVYAKNIAILSAGFPDDQTVMSPLAIELSKSDILVGVMCLPGYQRNVGKKTWRDFKKNGYTFDEIVICIKEAVKTLKRHSKTSRASLTGIFHDWGVPIGTIWANRCEEDGSGEGPNDLILIDVLGPPQNIELSHLSLCDSIITYSYRVVNSVSFLMGPILGLFSMVIGYGVISLLHIGPLNCPKDLTMIQKRIYKDPSVLQHWIYMAYVYYQMFIDIFFDKQLKDYFRLPSDLRKCPVLYLYGIQKRVMFHHKESVSILITEHEKGFSKSNAIGMNSGHWLYTQEQDFQACFTAMLDFILNSRGI